MVSFLSNPKLPPLFFFFLKEKISLKEKGSWVRMVPICTRRMMETRDDVSLRVRELSVFLILLHRYLLIVAYKYVCVRARLNQLAREFVPTS